MQTITFCTAMYGHTSLCPDDAFQYIYCVWTAAMQFLKQWIHLYLYFGNLPLRRLSAVRETCDSAQTRPNSLHRFDKMKNDFIL